MNRPIVYRMSSPLADVTRDTHELVASYQRAAQSGFDGVEILVDPSDYGTFSPAVVKSLESMSWPWDGPPCNAVAASCHSTDVNAACAEVFELFSVAQALGASRLNLSLPPVTGIDSPSTFARYQSAMNYAHEFLLRIRFDAEAAGVAIALEASSAGCLNSPVELRELLNQMNSPAVGACLDAGRLDQPGELDDWLRTLTHRVGAIRLTDGVAMRDHPTRSAPPSGTDAISFAGVDEMKSLVRVLNEINYEGLVIASELVAAADWNVSSTKRTSD